jgi:SAM-dependent methyltransferase
VIFAAVVGQAGTVYAQEIESEKLERVLERSRPRYPQIVPVLGETEDPRLPNGSLDLIYLHSVFHHLAKPQAMLRSFWSDLKPGGQLVIVDQRKGPLKDWAPMESREKEHHWTGETTVVRLAREAGFGFVNVLDDLWHETRPFVLVFRRPSTGAEPQGDPEAAPPLNLATSTEVLPALPATGEAVMFVGLDEGRALLPALAQQGQAAAKRFDVVLEEWAISKEELPEPSAPEGFEILRAKDGRLSIPEDTTLGAVIFADTYHRLWHPASLLAQIKPYLVRSGMLMIVDRPGPTAEPRRLANHRRRISPRQVKEELAEAGFYLLTEQELPSSGRFILTFRAGAEHESER